MKKHILISLLLSFFLASAFGQTTQPRKIRKSSGKKSKALNKAAKGNAQGAVSQQNVISAVETGMTVFVGYSQKPLKFNPNLKVKSVLISSFAHYELLCGKSVPGYYLWESVKLFFENGGKQCHIISVATTSAPIRSDLLEEGLEISRNVSAQILVVPDAVGLPKKDFYNFQEKMVDLCGELENRFAILNTLQPTDDVDDDFKKFRSNTSLKSPSYGAVYYPWLKNTSGKKVPPSGAVAGVYAQIDGTKGVWKAPANVSLKGIRDVSVSLTSEQRENANTDGSGKSINSITKFSGKGILVWGSRTLAGNDNEWRYVPVRRFATLVDNSVRNGLEWVVFEPNDADLWSSVEEKVSTFLSPYWRKGALQGARQDKAFYVKCGLGKTMTVSDIDNKKLIIEIGMAVVRPAEFIILRLEIDMK